MYFTDENYERVSYTNFKQLLTLVQSGLNYSTAHISLYSSHSDIKFIQPVKYDIGHYFEFSD